MTTTATTVEHDAAHRWIVGRDTSASSMTIWAALMGVPCAMPGVPLDADDFGRCWRLLVVIPSWRSRLPEVAKKYPEWTGIVREWGLLTAIYEAGLSDDGVDKRACKDLYDALQPLIDEGRIADGWERTGAGSWRKSK